jgi:hypothetical protein
MKGLRDALQRTVQDSCALQLPVHRSAFQRASEQLLSSCRNSGRRRSKTVNVIELGFGIDRGIPASDRHHEDDDDDDTQGNQAHLREKSAAHAACTPASTNIARDR